MTERPIPFSGPMVRAILAGTKTQTRRVITPQPMPWKENPCFLMWHRTLHLGRDPLTLSHIEALCTYGVPGDRLWVREAWRVRADQDDIRPRDLPHHTPWYCATGNGNGDEGPSGCGGGLGRKRPSMFMPRWASRLTLEVIGVRVERLQDITEADARAEGVEPDSADNMACICGSTDHRSPHFCARRAFSRGWNTLNGQRAPWTSNPWVWVIEFRRVA